MITNKVASSENGGLIKSDLLDSLSLGNPYELDTRLGVSGMTFKNPFNKDFPRITQPKFPFLPCKSLILFVVSYKSIIL